VWYSPACGGAYYYFDMTTSLGWSSTNTSVFTLNNSSPKGLLTGVGVGSAFANAQGTTACRAWYMMGGYCNCSNYTQASGGASCSVNPTVTVSCSNLDLALGTGAPTTTSGTCTATVNPGGGTYSWTKNKNTVNLANTSSATVIYSSALPSTVMGDTILTVTYTLNGRAASASSPGITVHRPTSLYVQIDHVNPSGYSCNDVCCLNGQPGCSYSTYLRQRTYVVQDQFGTQFPSVGIIAANVTESFGSLNSSCGSPQVNAGGAQVSTFNDFFYLCASECLPGGAGCSVSGTQTITVNGYSVRTESVVWTCTGVTLTP